MGLDVYVGSLTRYYARDWATITQQAGMAAGIPVFVVRGERPEVFRDPARVGPTVREWMTRLSGDLGEQLPAPLDWNETAQAPYFTDKPDSDCYAALLIWAALSERQDAGQAGRLFDDLAYRVTTEDAFKTRYPSLLWRTQIWLPIQTPLVFVAPGPGGETARFGSVHALKDELAALNERTWKADEAEIRRWRRASFAGPPPLETGARFAFAILWSLPQAAVDHRLVMLLDE